MAQEFPQSWYDNMSFFNFTLIGGLSPELINNVTALYKTQNSAALGKVDMIDERLRDK